jgi:hypothetical protein
MAQPNDMQVKQNRRKLRFESTQQIVVEVERLIALEQTGRLRRLGNWSLQQMLGHLTAAIDNAYDPLPLRPPPWPMRILGRMLKGIILNASLVPGVKGVRTDGKPFWIETRDLDDAADRYRAALARLDREIPRGRHPFFGSLSHRQWIKFHLRHAELHLGFLTERVNELIPAPGALV